MVLWKCASALLATSVLAACSAQRQVDAADAPITELGRYSFAIETRDGVRMTGLLYRTWENGTRTCITSMPEEYIEQVLVSDKLVVTR